MSPPERLSTVPTSSLFSWLLTVMAWELEFGVLLLHAFKARKLDPLGHAALLAVVLALTAFAWFKGKRDCQRYQWRQGCAHITFFQGFLVTVFFLGFGCVFGWIAERLIDH